MQINKFTSNGHLANVVLVFKCSLMRAREEKVPEEKVPGLFRK